MSLLILHPGPAQGRQLLSGHRPAAVAHLSPIGPLAATNQLQLAIGLPLRNQATLNQFLHDLYDPASPNYRKFLTPAEFAERFGPTPADYQAAVDFAQANGFKVTGKHPNRVVLDVQGTVGTIEKAFHVKMQTYQHPTENRTFHAPDTEPSLDLTNAVLNIEGLDNFSIPQPMLHVQPLSSATPAIGSGYSGTYWGNDFRNAYAPGCPLTGAGQSVGLVQFASYYPNDIATYIAQGGITTSVVLTNVLIDGATGTNISSNPIYNQECSMDIELVIAMAPGLSQVIVYEAPNNGNWADILSRMANDNLAKQLSASWTSTATQPDPTLEQIFQQMAAQGQAYFNAAGDAGAYAGSIPRTSVSTNIVSVGGTVLTTTNTGTYWSSEVAWSGSSGGISTNYSIPAYQVGLDMTANHGSTTMRNIPDVAMPAANVYLVCNNGNLGSAGGTSAATPLWAAFMALANEQAAANYLPPVGFPNPAFYAIGQSANYTNCFHDITVGNTTNSSSPNLFYATNGYDLCTGWGSPNGTNLINALAPPRTAPNLIISVATLLAESCAPTNGAIDPGETVTISFALQNVSPIATTNLVVTLLSAGGVTFSSAAQTYGAIAGGAVVSKPFTFIATNGACGSIIQAILQIQDGANNYGTLTNTFVLGSLTPVWTQNFDSVTAPALPSGWTTSAGGGASNWVTTNSVNDTAPNAVFSPDPGSAGSNALVSTSITITSSNAQLSFRNCYSTEFGYDGGVLEIKVGTNAFADILTAGGSFVTGGYNSILTSGSSNPLIGRSAWSGDSGGLITTTINLPASAAGQTNQLRWRLGSGNSGTGSGWWVDSITISDYACNFGGLSVVNAFLANLGPSAGTLNPVFAFNKFSYTNSVVAYATANLTVTPTLVNSNATIKVNGSPVTSGSPSSAISLIVGTNVINTVVVSPDLSTTNTYTLKVTRDIGSTNAFLTNLISSVGVLTPTFASNIFNYTASVPYTTNSLTVTPMAAYAYATITVNGTVVASGNASDNISLSVGTNVITTTVVSQNSAAIFTNTYTLTVTRAGARWWDGGSTNLLTTGDGVSGGGNGTWNTTIQNWDQGSGQIYAAWNNANKDIAIFGGTAGWVTNTSNITVGGLTFTSAYTITNAPGATLSFGTAGTISNSVAVTIATPLAGTGPITKTGTGTLTLTSTNTFSGGLILNGGNVSLGTALVDSLGASNGIVTVNSAIGLSIAGANFTATTVAKSFVLNANLALSGSAGVTITGDVSGAGSISAISATILAARTVTLASLNNTFTGAINAAQNGFVTVNSLSDDVGSGDIFLGTYFGPGRFDWGSGAVSSLTLNNRQIVMPGTANNGATVNNANTNATNIVTINSNLGVSSGGAKTLQLGGTNTGDNLFAGIIADGVTAGGAVISLTKADAGKWILSGTNTYSGDTTISGGTLMIGGAGQLGGGSYAGDITNNAAFVYASSAAQTLSGVISGTGSLTNAGGYLVLSSVNTYSGTTTISAGKLMGVTGGSVSNSAMTVTSGATNGVQLAAADGQWTCGALTYNTGTTYAEFDFDGLTPSTTTAPLQVTNALTFSSKPKLTLLNLGGVTNGVYPLIKYGSISGTLPTTFTAVIASGSISNDTVNKVLSLVVTNVFSSLQWAVGNGNWDIITANWKNTSGSGLTYFDGIPVTFDDTASGSSPILVTNAVTVSPASVTVNLTNKSYIISGSAIAGSATLTKNGTNTLLLTGTNTYSGGTVVNAGTLVVGSTNGAIGSGLLTLNGGSLSYTLNNTVITNTISLAAATTVDVPAGTNFTLGGVITNTGSLTKSDAGTLTLIAANTFSGGLILNGGTVTCGTVSLDSLGASNGVVTINSATTLTITGSGFGVTTLAKNFVLNANLTFPAAGNGATITGAVSGSGSLTPSVTGNITQRPLTLASLNNTFTGAIGAAQTSFVTVNSLADDAGSGNIFLGANGGYSRFDWGSGAVSPLTLNNRQIVMSGPVNCGAVVNNANTTATNIITINSNLGFSAGGAKTLTLGGANTGANLFAGIIADGTNGGASVISLTKADAGTWILSGTNNYTGITTISGGTLVIGGTGLLGNGNYAANIFNNAAFNYASSAAQTLSEVISGTGSLTNSGTGTLTLTGTNTYSGATTVSNGVLLVNGNSAAVTNTVTVATNAAFGGMGIIGSVVRYQNGALANFIVTPEANDTYSNSTYLTFTNAVFMTNVTVHVSLPDGLGNGAYVLATNVGTLTTNGALTLAAPDAGSYGAGASTSLSVSGNKLILTVNNASTATPIITGSTNFVNAFTTTYGTPSSNQRYTVTGTNLWVNILNTAAPGFEVSLNGVNYGSTVIVTNVGGSASNTVYIRLAATAPAGSYNSSNLVVLTSTGATSITNKTSVSGNSVTKANASITVTGYNVVYDGGGHTATVTVIAGVNGETNATVGTVNVSATTHTNAGSYASDAWTFTPTANYNTNNGTVSDTINKATPLLSTTLTASAITYGQGLSNSVVTGGVFTNAAGQTVGMASTNFVTPSIVPNAGTTNVLVYFVPTNTSYANVTNTVTVSVTNTFSSLRWAVGNGNWDTNTANWKNTNGISGLTYSDGAPVTFDDTASGSSPILVTNNLTVSPGSVTVNVTNKSYTLGGVGTIAGPATLTKNGTNTFILTSANSYNGGTTNNAGILEVDNNLALGTSLLVMKGGTLSNNVAGIVLSNPVSLAAAATVGVLAGNNLTLGGVITNTFGLTKAGAGILTLTGSNSYSGGTTNSLGILEADNNLALGTGLLVMKGGALSNNVAGITLTNPVSLAAAAMVSVSAGNNLTLGGVITNTFGLTKAGVGTLTLTGNSPYTGGTTISSGTLLISNAVASASTYNIASGATLELTAPSLNPLPATVTFNGTGTLKLDGGGNSIMIFGSAGTNIVAMSAGGLIQVSSNTVVTGSSSYSGYWNTNLGSLTVDGGSMINFVEAGALGVALAQCDALNGSGSVLMGWSTPVTTLSVGNANGSGTFSGVLSNNAAGAGFMTFRKNGTGTQILSGTNAYSGTTTVSNGVLLVNGNSLACTNVVTVISNAAFGGVGKIGGITRYQKGSLAQFTITPTSGGYSNSTYLTFTNAAYMTNVTVKVDLGSNLGNGTYVLATNYVFWTTNGSLTFVTNSGSLGTGGSGVVSVSGKNLILTVSGAAPSITGVTNFASAFTNTYGTASAAQTYPVTGANLASSITNTAAPGFEVSDNGGVTYGNTVIVTNVGGSASNTVYIRLAAMAPAGTYNSSNIVVLASAGATSITNTSSASGNGVAKANATFTVTPYSVAYDGVGHTATVTVIAGVNGETNATVGTVNVSATTHTNAGSYASDAWTFTPTANYNTNNGTVSDTINKATPLLSTTLTASAITYGQGLSNSVVTGGVFTNAAGQTVGMASTNFVTPGIVPNAGATNVSVYFVPTNASYANVTNTVNVTVNKANASIAVTGYNVAYDGVGHTATVTVIAGVNGETNATVGAVNVSATTHTNAGSYATDAWTFTPTANYNTNNGTVSDTINQASNYLALAAVPSRTNGYRDSVYYTATVQTNGGTAPDATGSVVFYYSTYGTNANVAFSTNSCVAGATNSLSITNLPRGTNLITAGYASYGNYRGWTNTLIQTVTNHPPVVAGNVVVFRAPGATTHIALTNLASKWSDVDGDTLSLTNIVSPTTNGIYLQFAGFTLPITTNAVNFATNYVGYTNGPNVNDRFSYTISDGFTSATGLVYVLTNSSAVFGQTASIGYTNTVPVVNFYGLSGLGLTYEVQRSADMVNWINLSTNTLTTNPVITITDTNNPSAFYRLKWLP